MALYDLSTITDMSGGNNDFMKEFISTFLESTPATLSELLEAWSAQDLEQVYRSAHKLKSSIDLAGVSSLYDEVRLVELTAKKGETEGLAESITKIEEVLKQVFEEIKQEFS
ncbi:MAG: Hpt domain-containing protein [Cytophagales bacterium]|nr:Hpt domain-containing protein [Cytophagales bacterium]